MTSEPWLSPLWEPLALPCGVTLKNRIIKSAMSDSLGDGAGNPTVEQIRLYQTWAQGGAAVAIIGEVQGDPHAAEKPGNLVLHDRADLDSFRAMAKSGQSNGALLWAQLGHAGAMAFPPISDPKGPSALSLPDLHCHALSVAEVSALPKMFAQTAHLARQVGLGGIQIHAAHGFLLSQFLSPLFNQRSDGYGGSIRNRMRLLLEVIDAVRGAVGPAFPIAVKLNATDQLVGGLTPEEALEVVTALDHVAIDMIDISGGTYFPGAKSASDGAGNGPYFVDFAKRARALTTKPLMLTGGFKTFDQADAAVTDGVADVVGLARAFILHPDLPAQWQAVRQLAPTFPKFDAPPEGGVTAWYTMRLSEIGRDQPQDHAQTAQDALKAYAERDAARAGLWLEAFPR
ncbi:MAG: oxidoreductase [Pseudomonadota bacterium]